MHPTTRNCNEAFFGYKILKNHYSESLRKRVVRAVDYLDRWAHINEAEYGEDIIPGDPERIRSFVKETREQIIQLKQNQ